MLLRLLTGMILSLAAALGILYLNTWVIQVLVVGLCVAASYELAVMILPPAARPGAILLTGIYCALILFGPPTFSFLVLSSMLLVMANFSLILFRCVPLEAALSQIAPTLFIIFYLGLAFAFLGLLRELEAGWAWLFLTLAATFSADTGAYFTGKTLGRHKLAPRVSPGKTIGGLLGGILFSVILSLVFNAILLKQFTWLECIGIAVMAGLVGPVGDLSVSLIKRSVGVKDSGKLIPGHGGILDRVDALLFTAPMVYAYATFFNAN